jgi:type I restriction enzyme S subunit
MSSEHSSESVLANLPDLPAGWRYTALADVVDPARSIAYGIVQPGPAIAGGVPIVRVQDFRNDSVDRTSPLLVSPEIAVRYARTKLSGGELLVTLVGSVGLTAIAPPECEGWNVARAVGVVPIRPDIGASFVRYALRLPVLQELIAAWCNTTVQATLNLKELARIPVLLPEETERGAICEVLEAVDAKIALNRHMNRTLEATAAALFRSWFVDFDPVVAKAEGRRAIGVPADVHESLPDKLIEAGELSTPLGWESTSFGDLALQYRDFVAPREIEPTTPYIGMEHMPRRSLALDAWSHASELDSAKARYRCGDVLFGKLRPYFHKVGIAPNDGVCSTEILVLRARSPELLGLVALLASSLEFVEYASAAAEGTRMPRVSWEYLAQYPVVVPPPAIARAFMEIVQPMFDRLVANVHENRTLAALRDTLLPQLFSGAIRLRDAERAVAAAL